jgi:hypothetical protein
MHRHDQGSREDIYQRQCLNPLNNHYERYPHVQLAGHQLKCLPEDIDLQSAALLASEADPTGVRTLGEQAELWI